MGNSFTAPTVTHTFENADSTAASGSVKWTLSGRMTNGTLTIVPASITDNLNGSGAISQAVTSNLDAATTPQDTSWRVDLNILGAEQESFVVVVPPQQTETNGSTTINLPTVQLSALTAALFMVGQSITGTGIPASTTIVSVNTTANTVTMSANATATNTGLSLTLGATIDLGALLPGAQQVG